MNYHDVIKEKNTEIERLRAALTAAEARVDRLENELVTMDQLVLSCKDELAAVRVNEARYFALRRECAAAFPSSKEWKRAIEVFFARYYTEQDIDAAIDAATTKERT